MSTIELVVPTIADETVPEGAELAARTDLASGGRVTLIDNGKPKARELLHLIADRLAAHAPVAEVTVFSKGSASRIIDDAEVADIAATSDVVIAGLGDCGACSACSVGDALKMEAAGVPSTVVISDVFVAHVASFAASMGFPGYHSVVVPHPVSSKGDDQLARFADAVSEQVARQLTSREPALAV